MKYLLIFYLFVYIFIYLFGCVLQRKSLCLLFLNFCFILRWGHYTLFWINFHLFYFLVTEFIEFDQIIIPPALAKLLPNPYSLTKKRKRGHRRKVKESKSEKHVSQFACQYCGKRYRWKSTMRRHEQVECGGKEPTFQCLHCSYKAKQKGNLNVHLKRRHNIVKLENTD